MKPRAPRMVELFVNYSKGCSKPFISDGLSGCIAYGKTNVPGEKYSHPVVIIRDGDAVVLEIHREKHHAPRTKTYETRYSNKLDKYMDDLEYTTSNFESANRMRIDEENKQRTEKRIYEQNLF